MSNLDKDFLQLSIEVKALLFGDFTLKSGKKSNYFFNITAFLESGYISELARLYSEKIQEASLDYQVIFGPAYKGIPLASAVATQLSKTLSRNIPISFDRKEKKYHGEGGSLVGSVENKKVMILDDVLTAGTAIRNAVNLVGQSGGEVSSVIVALDRQEIFEGQRAKEILENELNIPIYSISNLDKLILFLEKSEELRGTAEKLKSSL